MRTYKAVQSETTRSNVHYANGPACLGSLSCCDTTPLPSFPKPTCPAGRDTVLRGLKPAQCRASKTRLLPTEKPVSEDKVYDRETPCGGSRRETLCQPRPRAQLSPWLTQVVDRMSSSACKNSKDWENCKCANLTLGQVKLLSKTTTVTQLRHATLNFMWKPKQSWAKTVTLEALHYLISKYTMKQ